MKRGGGKKSTPKTSASQSEPQKPKAVPNTDAAPSGLSRLALAGAFIAVVVAVGLGVFFLTAPGFHSDFNLKSWQSKMRHFQVRGATLSVVFPLLV